MSGDGADDRADEFLDEPAPLTDEGVASTIADPENTTPGDLAAAKAAEQGEHWADLTDAEQQRLRRDEEVAAQRAQEERDLADGDAEDADDGEANDSPVLADGEVNADPNADLSPGSDGEPSTTFPHSAPGDNPNPGPELTDDDGDTTAPDVE